MAVWSVLSDDLEPIAHREIDSIARTPETAMVNGLSGWRSILIYREQVNSRERGAEMCHSTALHLTACSRSIEHALKPAQPASLQSRGVDKPTTPTPASRASLPRVDGRR